MTALHSGRRRPADWPALRAAQAHDAAARVPFIAVDVQRAGATRMLGSVARAHRSALGRWPRWLQIDDECVVLTAAAAERAEALATMHEQLRRDGLIRAWRDERFPLYARDGTDLGITIERAAARFWGTLTLGAHCNGYVAGADGVPRSLWIARRSDTKPTDPGLLDNLVGGGVPVGQTPLDTVVREGWEEAGLVPAQMTGLQRGGVVRLLRDIPEGLQREWIHVFDLAMERDTVPHNQDGEGAELRLLDAAEVIELAADGSAMTIDAALVTLDFALRHRLLEPAAHDALSAAWARWQ